MWFFVSFAPIPTIVIYLCMLKYLTNWLVALNPIAECFWIQVQVLEGYCRNFFNKILELLPDIARYYYMSDIRVIARYCYILLYSVRYRYIWLDIVTNLQFLAPIVRLAIFIWYISIHHLKYPDKPIKCLEMRANIKSKYYI